MKRIFVLFALLSAITLSGCDIPKVEFEQKSYEVSADGEQITIPVLSTGVDHIKISTRDAGDFEWQHYVWGPHDEEHSEGEYLGTDWVEMVEFIDNYNATRALAEWHSAVVLDIKPNTSKKKREAVIQITSFGADDKVRIKQAGI